MLEQLTALFLEGSSNYSFFSSHGCSLQVFSFFGLKSNHPLLGIVLLLLFELLEVVFLFFNLVL